MKKNPIPDIEVYPNEQNIFNWKATIKGPSGTPYEEGKIQTWILNPIAITIHNQNNKKFDLTKWSKKK